MSEPVFERQADEFARRIHTLARQQQEVLYELLVERMDDNRNLLPRVNHRVSLLGHLRLWWAGRRNSVIPVNNPRGYGPVVIVIDADSGTVVEENQREKTRAASPNW